jgi:hypothetical protein
MSKAQAGAEAGAWRRSTKVLHRGLSIVSQEFAKKGATE